MRNITLFFLLTSLCGCMTMSPKLDDSDTLERITLPKTRNNLEIQNMKEASKNQVKIGTKLNTDFDFYYTPSGNYYVIPVNKGSGRKLDVSMYDATLIVDENGNDPEYISLALESNQILSGFGNARSGSVKFRLDMHSTDNSLTPSFNFDFSASMGQ